MTAVSNVTQPWLDAFAASRDARCGAEVSWLATARKRALQRLEETGFPTGRDEAWKYTDARPLAKRAPRPATPPTDDAIATARQVLANAALPDYGGARVVFVDGHFAAALSATTADGLTVTPLSVALADDPESVRPWLESLLAADGDGFAVLNSAYLTDGLLLRMLGNVAAPVHVVHAMVSDASAHPRSIVDIAGGAHGVLVESHVGKAGVHGFVNTVVQVRLGAGSALTHYRWVDEADAAAHLAHVRVRQGRDSHYRMFQIDLGGRLARHDIGIDLAGENAETLVCGLYLAAGRRHVDQHSHIDHSVPHTRSEELVRGVVGRHGRGVFHGKVVVHPGAQKTDARQSCDSLLLTTDAEADARPQLEIHADDVKCTHGATVGQLDADALFYLRSRGIDTATAHELLVRAFVDAVAQRVELASLRELLEARMASRMHVSRGTEVAG